MRLIDADELRNEVDDLSNDMYHPVYGVTENDIECAEEVEAIPVDWIDEYLEKVASGYDFLSIKRLVDAWYDEIVPKKKKPTLTEVYNRGMDRGVCVVKESFRSALQQLRDELIARKESEGDNGGKTEGGDNSPVQE